MCQSRGAGRVGTWNLVEMSGMDQGEIRTVASKRRWDGQSKGLGKCELRTWLSPTEKNVKDSSNGEVM